MIEGQLTQEEKETIPACFHCMLKFLERKEVKATGRKVGEGDYSEAGLLQPINKEKWVRFWNRARAGKRGGESGLHATLIKAALKKVFTETTREGKKRQVSKTEMWLKG